MQINHRDSDSLYVIKHIILSRKKPESLLLQFVVGYSVVCTVCFTVVEYRCDIIKTRMAAGSRGDEDPIIGLLYWNQAGEEYGRIITT